MNLSVDYPKKKKHIYNKNVNSSYPYNILCHFHDKGSSSDDETCLLYGNIATIVNA